jgi:hypothetical protein
MLHPGIPDRHGSPFGGPLARASERTRRPHSCGHRLCLAIDRVSGGQHRQGTANP